jgi:hypothetical protein
MIRSIEPDDTNVPSQIIPKEIQENENDYESIEKRIQQIRNEN